MESGSGELTVAPHFLAEAPERLTSVHRDSASHLSNSDTTCFGGVPARTEQETVLSSRQLKTGRRSLSPESEEPAWVPASSSGTPEPRTRAAEDELPAAALPSPITVNKKHHPRRPRTAPGWQGDVVRLLLQGSRPPSAVGALLSPASGKKKQRSGEVPHRGHQVNK